MLKERIVHVLPPALQRQPLVRYEGTSHIQLITSCYRQENKGLVVVQDCEQSGVSHGLQSVL